MICIKCPRCNSYTKVTKTINKKAFVVRYRKCENGKCKYIFKTKEMMYADWDYRAMLLKIKDWVREVK